MSPPLVTVWVTSTVAVRVNRDWRPATCAARRGCPGRRAGCGSPAGPRTAGTRRRLGTSPSRSRGPDQQLAQANRGRARGRGGRGRRRRSSLAPAGRRRRHRRPAAARGPCATAPIASPRGEHAPLGEQVQDPLGLGSGATVGRGEHQLSRLRGLVGVVDAGEALDLARPGLGVETLGVPPLALLDRGVDEDLDEAQAGGVVQRRGPGPGPPVGADERDERRRRRRRRRGGPPRPTRRTFSCGPRR